MLPGLQIGFIRGSEMESVRFDSRRNFYMDPVRPRLWDLMSKDDVARYAYIPVSDRPDILVSTDPEGVFDN